MPNSNNYFYDKYFFRQIFLFENNMLIFTPEYVSSFLKNNIIFKRGMPSIHLFVCPFSPLIFKYYKSAKMCTFILLLLFF